jgi:glycosyltransferase involved in cell wall biosynthesis
VSFVLFNDGRAAGPEGVPEGVEVIDIPVPPKKRIWDLVPQQLAFAREFRAILRRVKPDLVHTNFAVPSVAARWAAAKEGVPLVVSTQHEIYGSMYFQYRWGLRLTERYCSAITYVSKTVARSFGRPPLEMGSEDFDRKPCHGVIPNGVNIPLIHNAVAGIENKIPGKVVCVGRMVPEKGQALLLGAFQRAAPFHPGARLFLIGSGPMEKKLKAMTVEKGLRDKVEFMGWLSHEQVLREMASAQLVVVPSLSVQEGFGLVLAESLVCGTPLLASDIPLFCEVLDPFPGRRDFFAEGDERALANGLAGHLGKISGLTGNLKPLSPEEENKLSADTMVESYIRLYNWLLKDRKLEST